MKDSSPSRMSRAPGRRPSHRRGVGRACGPTPNASAPPAVRQGRPEAASWRERPWGPSVQIYTPLHPFNAERRRREAFGKPIEIGSDVWVGGGAIILAGVRIGSRAVIGAGSVVTRDVPDAVFAAGNPCRVIRAIVE